MGYPLRARGRVPKMGKASFDLVWCKWVHVDRWATFNLTEHGWIEGGRFDDFFEMSGNGGAFKVAFGR
ncbi:hypothetical protein JTE90_018210 [Oedothorax gibbosus]|uniref:Uncharacterized protein n=1 Tax=Oedothorax gibbosus TaxID=931172 RepID=A0AAV6U8D2_9ARAC|nr:hypothetical protein JTE90_018210 [Oedothorax gibbosus]